MKVKSAPLLCHARGSMSLAAEGPTLATAATSTGLCPTLDKQGCQAPKPLTPPAMRAATAVAYLRAAHQMARAKAWPDWLRGRLFCQPIRCLRFPLVPPTCGWSSQWCWSCTWTCFPSLAGQSTSLPKRTTSLS